MMKNQFFNKILSKKLRLSDLIYGLFIPSILIFIHLVILLKTAYIEWPELLYYPWLISKGLFPYRDIVLMYFPGAYYLLLPIYKIVGFSLLGQKTAAYLFILITDLGLFILSRKIFRNMKISCLVLGFFIFWHPVFEGNTIWYETILSPFYLIAFYLSLLVLKKNSLYFRLLLGIAFTFILFIKQPAMWVLFVTILYIFYLNLNNIKKAFIYAFEILIIPAVSVVILIFYYYSIGIGSEFWYQTVIIIFSLARIDSMYIMLPPLRDLVLILPSYIPALAVLIKISTVDKKTKNTVILIFLWILAGILAGQPRWGIFRLVPSLIFAALAFGIFVKLNIKNIFRRNIFIIFVLSLIFILSIRSYHKFYFIRQNNYPDLLSGKINVIHSKIINSIGTSRYFVFGNYDYLYMYSNEKPQVLPWVPLFPWNGEIPGLQEKLINEIEKHKIPYVIYIPFHKDKIYYLDYKPDKIYAYLENAYEEFNQIDNYGWILKRK